MGQSWCFERAITGCPGHTIAHNVGVQGVSITHHVSASAVMSSKAFQLQQTAHAQLCERLVPWSGSKWPATNYKDSLGHAEKLTGTSLYFS